MFLNGIPCSFSVASAFPSRSREPSSSASQNVWVFVFLHSDFSSSLISSSLTGELPDAKSDTWSYLSEWTIITDARLLRRSLHQVLAVWASTKWASLFPFNPEKALAALYRFFPGISWARSFFRFFLHDPPPWKQKKSIWCFCFHTVIRCSIMSYYVIRILPVISWSRSFLSYKSWQFSG